HFKQAGFIARQLAGQYRSANLIDFEWSHCLISQTCKIRGIERASADQAVAEGKLSPLLRREIRSPIVVHQPRKNGGRLRTKFSGPVASHNIAKIYQRRVVWNHGSHELGI